MTTITLNIPWMLFIPIVLFFGYGLLELIRRCWQVYCIYKQLQTAGQNYEQNIQFLTEADQKAQELIELKIKETWRSFDVSNWLDIIHIWEESRSHLRSIAAIYHPDSNQPEFEITVIELLKLNDRINRRILSVLTPLESLHKISINSLLAAHSILEKTHQTINEKGIKTGAGIASRIWQALNIINPQYWINHILLRGVSEVAYRKAMTSIYRITGNEAVKIYRASTAENIDIEKSIEEEFENMTASQQTGDSETNSQTIEPEIIIEESRYYEQKHHEPFEENQNSESTTNKIYNGIANTFTQFFEGGLQLWEKLAKPDAILHYYQKQGEPVENLQDIRSLSVEKVQTISAHYRKKGEWLSAAEGAVTGVGGFMLIAVDAVSLIALQLRTIQQIGYCYGFDMSKPEEKLFAAKLLCEAYKHPSNKDRKAVLMQMKWAAELIKGSSPFRILYKKLFTNGIHKAAQIIGLKLGSRKAAQLVPFLGAAVGGYLNKKVMKDIAEIADEVYRDRFLSRQSTLQYNDIGFIEEKEVSSSTENS